MSSNQQHRMLFIIREGGIQKFGYEIIEYLLLYLDKLGFTVLEASMANVNNVSKMVHEFYKEHVTEHGEKRNTILENNSGKVLFYVVTDYKNSISEESKKSSKSIKMYIRHKFPNKANYRMNYIHSSDNSYEAEKEIAILKSHSTTNLSQLGSTYRYMHRRKHDDVYDGRGDFDMDKIRRHKRRGL
jgi:nucleoside diphosphate kinase